MDPTRSITNGPRPTLAAVFFSQQETRTTRAGAAGGRQLAFRPSVKTAVRDSVLGHRRTEDPALLETTSKYLLAESQPGFRVTSYQAEPYAVRLREDQKKSQSLPLLPAEAKPGNDLNNIIADEAGFGACISIARRRPGLTCHQQSERQGDHQ